MGANSGTNACSSIKPFYWEIGDTAATLAAIRLPQAGRGPAELEEWRWTKDGPVRGSERGCGHRPAAILI